jgi:hypothetical protein
LDSSIVYNKTAADQFGGGICAAGPTTYLLRSVVAHNTAGRGGGIANDGDVGETSATLINSTVADNHATQYGGGIYNFRGGVLNLYNSTIAYNFTDIGTGGGILVTTDDMEPMSIHKPANLYNTLVAGNYHINTAFADDCYGALQTHAKICSATLLSARSRRSAEATRRSIHSRSSPISQTTAVRPPRSRFSPTATQSTARRWDVSIRIRNPSRRISEGTHDPMVNAISVRSNSTIRSSVIVSTDFKTALSSAFEAWLQDCRP